MLCLSRRPNTSRGEKELAHVAGMCPLYQDQAHFHCHPAGSPGITRQCEDPRGETEFSHCRWYLCDFMQVTQPLWVWKWKSESHSVVSDSLRPHGLYSPWNSPGQHTGVGSRSLLQGIVPTQGLKSIALLKKKKKMGGMKMVAVSLLYRVIMSMESNHRFDHTLWTWCLHVLSGGFDE